MENVEIISVSSGVCYVWVTWLESLCMNEREKTHNTKKQTNRQTTPEK